MSSPFLLHEATVPSGILVHAAELADVGGERVVVCTEAAGRVSTWNPSTGEWRPVGLAPPGDVDAREVARFTSVGALDGRATLLAAGDEHDGHVVAWDLETGAVVRGPLVGEYFAGAWSVLLAEVEGRPFALAGNAGPGLTFWELDTDGAQAVHLAGPTDGTTSLEFGELAGGPVAVSAGHDGVRVWDLRNPGAIRSVFYADEHAYRGAGISRVDGREIVVAAVGSVVELLDPEWNEPIGEPLTGHDGVITALALTEVGGRALAVTAAEDRTARVWDLAAGAPVGEPLTDHGKAIAGVSTGELADGRAVAVTAGGRDGVVRIWDLAAIVA